MAQKKILMHVDPLGKTTIEAQGYEGGECLDATRPFEDLFGKQEGERTYTGGECMPDQGERVRS